MTVVGAADEIAKKMTKPVDKISRDVTIAPMESLIMTPKEVAERWGIDERTVRRYLNAGKLRGFKLGTHWRVTLERVREYETENERRAAKRAPGQA